MILSQFFFLLFNPSSLRPCLPPSHHFPYPSLSRLFLPSSLPTHLLPSITLSCALPASPHVFLTSHLSFPLCPFLYSLTFFFPPLSSFSLSTFLSVLVTDPLFSLSWSQMLLLSWCHSDFPLSVSPPPQSVCPSLLLVISARTRLVTSPLRTTFRSLSRSKISVLSTFHILPTPA